MLVILNVNLIIWKTTQFITYLLKMLKIIFWNESFHISHMVSKLGSYYMKWHGSIYFQLS
jgi:hypothetical protein